VEVKIMYIGLLGCCSYMEC